MSALRRAGVVCVTAVAIVGLWATPAFAHAVLLSTNPVDGSFYPTATTPTSVSMHFGEDVGVKLGAVRVYDEHGKLVNTGAPGHPTGDGSTVEASLPKLGPGTYVVTWRVISADTHPVSGAFTFTVGAHRRDVSKLATQLLSSTNGSRSVGVLYGVERFVLFASLIAFLGGTAFVVLVWPVGRRAKRARQILWMGWAATLAITIVGITIEGIYAAAYPLSKLLDPTVLSDTLHGRYGETAVARMALLIVALPLLSLLIPVRRRHDDVPSPLPRWWYPAATVVGIATIVTVTLASHGTTGRWTGLAIPADVLHVSAVSLWFGGLLMLTVRGRPRRRRRNSRRRSPALFDVRVLCGCRDRCQRRVPSRTTSRDHPRTPHHRLRPLSPCEADRVRRADPLRSVQPRSRQPLVRASAETIADARRNARRSPPPPSAAAESPFWNAPNQNKTKLRSRSTRIATASRSRTGDCDSRLQSRSVSRSSSSSAPRSSSTHGPRTRSQPVPKSSASRVHPTHRQSSGSTWSSNPQRPVKTRST